MVKNKSLIKSLKGTCHRGTVKVFDYRNLHFYGGGMNKDVYVPTRGRWVVVSAIDVRVGSVRTNYDTKHLSMWSNVLNIYIDIEDMGVPDMPKEFWESLCAELKWLSKGEDLNVLCMCEGGHGRTGLFLSILAGLLLGKDNPVQFVRKNYCFQAVETIRQEEYIARITDTRPPVRAASYGKKLGKADINLDEKEAKRQREFIDEIMNNKKGEE